jgi:hypothetical protein
MWLVPLQTISRWIAAHPEAQCHRDRSMKSRYSMTNFTVLYSEAFSTVLVREGHNQGFIKYVYQELMTYRKFLKYNFGYFER